MPTPPWWDTTPSQLSYAYVSDFYQAHPHRGHLAGWAGCAGQAPDISREARRMRRQALIGWERHITRARKALRFPEPHMIRADDPALIELDMLSYACAKEAYLTSEYPLFAGDPS
ncbi:MAG TPA: hypothetical protein VKQ36_14250, partial [Ktedonobacterales bacterium]|nr:hypothetical protein [Ktedonobacterales bacterium]